MSEHDERHTMLPATEHEEPVPACLDCETWCDASMPCRCCLTLRAEKAEAAIERVREVCEQQVMDRSLYSSDRQFHTLDRIDGWNDALEMVERALDEPEVTA